jgi:hypothetical protein
LYQVGQAVSPAGLGERGRLPVTELSDVLVGIFATPQFPTHAPHLKDPFQPPTVPLFGPLDQFSILRQNVFRLRPNLPSSFRMNLVAGAQQPARAGARGVKDSIASRDGSAIGYTVRGSMHSNARTQFSNQVFLGRPLDNLTDCEVFPIRMLSMKKRRRNEDFIGDFDFRHYSSYRLIGPG